MFLILCLGDVFYGRCNDVTVLFFCLLQVKAGVTWVPFESCCTGKTIRGILYNQILYIAQNKTRVLIGLVKLVIKVQTSVMLLACGSKRTSKPTSYQVLTSSVRYQSTHARPNGIYLLNGNKIVFQNVWKCSMLRVYRRPEIRRFLLWRKETQDSWASLSQLSINRISTLNCMVVWLV